MDSRGRFNCGDAYHERHHIKPKCLGGTNEQENLIDLYAREHFIAHKLLAKENPNNLDLSRSYYLMAYGFNNEYQDRPMQSPEEYEDARIMFSENLKKLYSDKANHPCYGKHASEATKRKQSIVAKERLKDPTKNPMYGKYKENNPNYGRKRSMEYCERQSKRMKEFMETKDYNGANNPRAKKVIRLSDMKIYDCGINAAKENGIKYTTFKNKCQKQRGYMYYDDYLKLKELEEIC